MSAWDGLRRVEMRIRKSLKRRSLWRHVRGRRIRVMKKLDESKVQWIVREKRKGEMTSAQIAQAMKISTVWVKKLWARYRDAEPGGISYPARMGRPEKGLAGRLEHSAVLGAHCRRILSGGALQDAAEEMSGVKIPYRTIHRILLDNDSASRNPRKSGRRKWIRYERTYSNSMWHTDYKMLPDGRWLVSYEDDASRLITGYGVFDNATTANALAVLRDAVARYGRPASILTDHGSQFYANESECRERGESAFEEYLAEHGIRHILARIRHPQTNGKLERFHGEIERKLRIFEGSSADRATRGRPDSDGGHVGGPFNITGKRDAIERLVDWYNNDRPHMSLDWDRKETPAQAFIRKMPPRDEMVIDRQTGEEYDVLS